MSFVSSTGNILCRLIKIELYKIFAIINCAIKGLHCISISGALIDISPMEPYWRKSSCIINYKSPVYKILFKHTTLLPPQETFVSSLVAGPLSVYNKPWCRSMMMRKRYDDFEHPMRCYETFNNCYPRTMMYQWYTVYYRLDSQKNRLLCIHFVLSDFNQSYSFNLYPAKGRARQESLFKITKSTRYFGIVWF